MLMRRFAAHAIAIHAAVTPAADSLLPLPLCLFLFHADIWLLIYITFFISFDIFAFFFQRLFRRLSPQIIFAFFIFEIFD
jgi:hypothetical protein